MTPSATGSTSAPRILMLTQFLQIGGLERMVLNLSRRLHETKLAEVVVTAYDHTGDETHQDLVPELMQAGIATKIFRKPPGFSIKIVRHICGIVREHNIDIIHTHDLGALLYGALVKVFCWRKVKLVHTQHSFVNVDRKRRYRFYQSFFSRFVNELVAVSADTEQMYRQVGFHGGRLSVIENGVCLPPSPSTTRTERLRARDELLKHLPNAARLSPLRNLTWLLYLARVAPVKGQQHVLELWRMLPSELRKATALLIVGPEAEPGAYAPLHTAIASLPDNSQVIVAGGTTRPSDWLLASDVGISCSEFEGLPLGPLEAIGHGLPLLLSDIPGHSFLKDHALFFSLSNASEGTIKLAELLRKSIASDGQLHDNVRYHAAWVRERYSLEAMTERYREIYSRLIEELRKA